MSVSAGQRRRRTQAERRAETRDALLDAGERVFARRGFHGAGLEEVAEDAGVSRGSVYYHFADKASLFVAIVRRRCEARVVALEAPETREELLARYAPPPPQLGDTRLLVEFAAYAAEHPAAREELHDALTACRDAVTGIVGEALERRGVEPSMPTDRLAIALIALSAGLGIERATGPRVPDGLLAEVVDLLIAGLEHRQKETSAS